MSTGDKIAMIGWGVMLGSLVLTSLVQKFLLWRKTKRGIAKDQTDTFELVKTLMKLEPGQGMEVNIYDDDDPSDEAWARRMKILSSIMDFRAAVEDAAREPNPEKE